MKVWYTEEITVADCPPHLTINLKGIMNPISPAMPLIEIELVISSDDPSEEDLVSILFQHNPFISHHEYTLDDVLAKYSSKIAKWREKLSRMDYQELSQLS